MARPFDEQLMQAMFTKFLCTSFLSNISSIWSVLGPLVALQFFLVSDLLAHLLPLPIHVCFLSTLLSFPLTLDSLNWHLSLWFVGCHDRILKLKIKCLRGYCGLCLPQETLQDSKDYDQSLHYVALNSIWLHRVTFVTLPCLALHYITLPFRHTDDSCLFWELDCMSYDILIDHNLSTLLRTLVC